MQQPPLRSDALRSYLLSLSDEDLTELAPGLSGKRT